MGLLLYVLLLLTGFLGPLILWLMKKDKSPFIDHQGKEALNWGITFSIVVFVLFVTVIGAILVPVVWLLHIVFSIMGLLKAKDGIPYRFPFALRLLK